MMKDLSNDALLVKVKALVGKEKQIIVEVIELFKEIDLRKLYLKSGYPSMFAFATEFLGYSEFEAHTRLQAARLTHVIPEVATKILSGELNLSVAAHAQSQFRKEDERREKEGETPMNREEKREVLEMVSSCSRRKAEEKLNDHFGQQSDLKEYSFLASRGLQSEIDALMDEYSHINFARDLGKLVEILVKEKLAQVEKKRNGPTKVAQGHGQKAKETKRNNAKPINAKPINAKPIKRSRPYTSIHTQREVWRRTGNMCTYLDPVSGKRCCSKHALEFDHIVPLSRGGSHSADNLTILCDAHNRWKGERRDRG